MNRVGIVSVVVALTVCFTTARAEEGFKPLFNGKSLDGWHGDPKLWSVEDGAIAGTTDTVEKLRHNTFLATRQTYKNFILKLKFKLRNGNSGVQVRSKQHDEYVVKGYQADIADSNVMGILYEEGGRGTLANVKVDEVKKHVKENDWNDYVITVNEANIKQVLNGYTTVDFTDQPDKGAREGIIALQLHVGPKMKIWFKDIAIKELP